MSLQPGKIEIRQWDRLIDDPFQCLFALGPDEGIGILSLGEKGTLTQQSAFQEDFKTPGCGFSPGSISIKKGNNVFRIAPKDPHVIGSEGGPQCGDDTSKTRLSQGNDIQITFHDNHPVHGADGLLRLVEAVELGTLAKERGFLRVEILR